MRRTESDSLAAAVRLASSLAECVKQMRVTSGAVDGAKRNLRQRRDLRNEPTTRKGHEYVVEWLFRPGIERFVASRCSGSQLHEHCYSSHFHTTTDDAAVWKRRWRQFRETHRAVDTSDSRSRSRRADLFVLAEGKSLVSVEFKYLPPRRAPHVEALVKQMKQHLTGHGASVLVIYCAEPRSARCDGALATIRAKLAGERYNVVDVTGPVIAFP
jgi:hypothetical protein